MNPSITPAAIRELRTRLGINQTDFANRLNAYVPGLAVTQPTVARWETGKHLPSGVAAEAIRRLERDDRRGSN